MDKPDILSRKNLEFPLDEFYSRLRVDRPKANGLKGGALRSGKNFLRNLQVIRGKGIGSEGL